MSEPSGERIQKVLAQAGLGSRREIERWIADGRVSVNGDVVTLGARLLPSDHVRVDGKTVKLDTDVRIDPR
ncbi:S4 domain-containing protein, partial [Oleiphilus sp. HI0080]